jgi:hypothetical protein
MGLVGACAAVCALALAVGCGSSSTSSATSTTSSTQTATTTSTSAAAPARTTARDFTCKEINANSSKAHEAAALVKSDITRITGGTVIASSEFANRQVRAVCVHAAPGEKYYIRAVRAIGVSEPVIQALSKEP